MNKLESVLKPSGWETSRFVEGITTPETERGLIELARAIEQPDLHSSSYGRYMAVVAGLTGLAAVVEGCATVPVIPSVKVPANCPPIKSDYGDNYDMDGRQRDVSHNGIDIVEEMGYPVIAAADGKVVIGGEHSVSGNRVFIYHGKDSDGRSIFTMYGHLQQIHDSVEGGKDIKRGAPIGRIGNTGSDMPKSRTPHLHFFVLVSKTGEYSVKGNQVYFGLTGWTDDNPHKFWLLNDKGEVLGFSKGTQYPTSQIRFTYPVPCK